MRVTINVRMKSKIENRKSKIRAAFTLVELLVVIAIISILAGLLLPAISKVSFYMDEVRTLAEIRELSGAIEQFKQKYGRYFPSKIILREGSAYQVNNPDPEVARLERESKTALEQMFTGINAELSLPTGRPGIAWHDWNGDEQGQGSQVWILEGDECLVFFLGGIPNATLGLTGFCQDKAHPTLFTPSRPREGPFYEFKTQRLDRADRYGHAGHESFMVYLDVFGTRGTTSINSANNLPFSKPYAYFLAGPGSFNNYNADLLSSPLRQNDCTAICGLAFVPYYESRSPPDTDAKQSVYKYQKSSTFQIISACRDQEFGGGGRYPLDGTDKQDFDNVIGDGSDDDRDNLTNFSEGRLETRR